MGLRPDAGGIKEFVGKQRGNMKSESIKGCFPVLNQLQVVIQATFFLTYGALYICFSKSSDGSFLRYQLSKILFVVIIGVVGYCCGRCHHHPVKVHPGKGSDVTGKTEVLLFVDC